MSYRQEPVLPADLEDSGETSDWNAKVLRELARQLGFGNDFYYPLLGAAQQFERINCALNKTETERAEG
jgi:hypothetical protein